MMTQRIELVNASSYYLEPACVVLLLKAATQPLSGRGNWKMLSRLLRIFDASRAKSASSSADITRRIGRLIEDKISSSLPVICNLGCGNRHHPEWINIDFHGIGD